MKPTSATAGCRWSVDHKIQSSWKPTVKVRHVQMLGIPCAKPGQIERAHCFLVPWCWELSVNHHSWQKWAHLKGNSGILASLFCSRQHLTHTPWDSLHSTCCNVFDQTSHSPVPSLYDFLVFGFLNTEPKGCKDGLGSNLKLAVEQCFFGGTHLLVPNWYACLSDQRDYF